MRFPVQAARPPGRRLSCDGRGPWWLWWLLGGAHWRARRVGSRRAAAAPPSALRLRAHALLADVLGGEFALPHLARLRLRWRQSPAKSVTVRAVQVVKRFSCLVRRLTLEALTFCETAARAAARFQNLTPLIGK